MPAPRKEGNVRMTPEIKAEIIRRYEAKKAAGTHESWAAELKVSPSMIGKIVEEYNASREIEAIREGLKKT